MELIWRKKAVIPAVILGLVLGVSAFRFTQGRKTPPPQAQPERGQRTESRPRSITSVAAQPETDKSRPLTPIETVTRPSNQDADHPEALESTGKKDKEKNAVLPPRPPQEPTPSEPRKTGTLSVNAQPWAEVWIDGKSWGETPLELELPVGRHKVVLVYEKQKITLNVTIKAGKVELLTHAW